MKNVGIYTFWNVPNYGTFLQAYALQRVIEELDKEAEVRQIAYLDKMHYDQYYGRVNFCYRKKWINPRFYKEIINRFLSWKEICERQNFLDYYGQIKNTGPLNKKTIKEQYFDTIVLGSDIIWDYSIRMFNHDIHLFGNGFHANNVISYAASFGTVKSGMEVPEYVINGLERMKEISVRDENSKKLVLEMTGREAEIVLDPTFLWDFMSDKKILGRPVKEKYMVVYGSKFTDYLVQGAQAYAKKHGLKIICLDSLSDNFTWCDEVVSQRNLTPFGWCAYFKYAEVVFTCTYHGLLFGLIYQKRLVFYPTPFIMDKAASLIASLGMEEVLISSQDFDKKADWEWDYQNTLNKRINFFKEKSFAYLKKALNIKEE